jgi:hypothetical protein
MAFKLKHFLAGAAKEATNINEERRKQAMEMVQASMEMQGKGILDTQKAYKEQGKELEVAAAGLRRLNLNDAQIARVLNEGVDFANDFVEKAPIAAKARGVTPDTFVTIADPDAPLIPVSEYINRGDIAGRVEVGSFKRVEGLPKSIFGGTFDVGQDQRMEQYASTLGVEEQPAQERISAPEGTIDIMGMLGSDVENYEFSGIQQQQAFTDALSSASGMKGGMVDGAYVWASDVPGIQTMVNSDVTDLLVRANELKRTGRYSDVQIRKIVLDEFEANAPKGYNFNSEAAAEIKRTITNDPASPTNALNQALASGNAFKVAQLLKLTQPEVYGSMSRNDLMNVVNEMIKKARSSQVGVTK